jgi:hypothetical protein
VHSAAAVSTFFERRGVRLKYCHDKVVAACDLPVSVSFTRRRAEGLLHLLFTD